MESETLTTPGRRFLPVDLDIREWSVISPFYEQLENRLIDSSEALLSWMADLSELETVIQEHVGWLY
ncbi:MAG: hypothetical protein ACKO7B_05600, partial [Flavobacteriales bacterium]